MSKYENIEVILIHRRAMDTADEAKLAKLRSDFDMYKKLIKEAFELESQAANYFKNDIENEPNRSFLYMSAASLAMECNDIRSAKDLINTALSGNPSEEIKNELKNLLP